MVKTPIRYKIYVLDCENFICTVTVMQYKILICHLLSRWINQVVSWHTWSIFILSPKWPHLIDDWLRVRWRLGRLIGNITNQVLKPFNEHLLPIFHGLNPHKLSIIQQFQTFKLDLHWVHNWHTDVLLTDKYQNPIHILLG